MRTTYLAIFGSSPENITGLKKLLVETAGPEEKEELDNITNQALTDPDQLSEAGFQKLFKEDGKIKVARMFEGKLEPLVKKMLSDHEDQEDIPWSVIEVIISDNFFAELDPDMALDFNKRYSIDLLPERILLPDGEWTDDKPEEVLNKYKHGNIFVFFSVDY